MFASSSSRILRSLCRQSNKFCTDAKPKYQKPHTKNVSLAIVLLGFVGGVYYTAINKMRVDDFTKIIEEDKAQQKLEGKQ